LYKNPESALKKNYVYNILNNNYPDCLLIYEEKVSQQINTYSDKAKKMACQPVDYYRKQEAFYRGLF